METLRWEYVWYTNLLDFYSHSKSQANGCLANLLGKMMINHGMGSVFSQTNQRNINLDLPKSNSNKIWEYGYNQQTREIHSDKFFFIIQHIQKSKYRLLTLTYNVDFTVQIL